jgi:hypothetical protein
MSSAWIESDGTLHPAVRRPAHLGIFLLRPILIHAHLTRLSRPEQVVYFVRHVLGVGVVSKEVLSQRADAYRNWLGLNLA